MNKAHYLLTNLLLGLISLVLSVGELSALAKKIEELEKVTVNAYREERHPWLQTSSSYEIKKDEIETLGEPHNIEEILEINPSIDINSQGANGSSASLFLRGLNAEHTLVMIDGVIANDPSNPSRTFNIGLLDSLQVEKIEVLPGSRGFLHGSDAIGGVVNIVTKSARGSGGDWKLVGGTPAELSAQVSKQISNNKNAAARISFHFNKEEAISSADSRLGNEEKDGRQKIQLNTKGFWDINKKQTLDYSFQYSHQDLDLDAGGGVFQDDPNFNEISILINSKAFIRHKVNKSHLLKYGVGVNYTNRESVNEPDLLRNDDTTGIFTGVRVKPEIIMENYFSHFHLLTQIEATYEQADFFSEFNGSSSGNQSADNITYSLASKISNPNRQRLLWEFGARSSLNSNAQNAFVYLVGTGYRWNRLKLRTSLSSGFKNPSLFQIFSPQFGNRSLSAESSQTFEVGGDYRFSKTSKLSVSYFHNTIDDQIGFSTRYENTGFLETSGVEAQLSKQFKRVKINLWANALDIKSSSQVLRKPKLRFGGSLSTGYKKFQGALKIRFVSERDDFDFVNNQAVVLDSYTKLDLSLRCKMSRKLSLSANVSNLLDTDYTETFGYGIRGRSFLLTLQGKY